MSKNVVCGGFVDEIKNCGCHLHRVLPIFLLFMYLYALDVYI